MSEIQVCNVKNTRDVVAAVPDSVIEEYLQSFGNKLSAKHRNQFIQIARAFNLNPFIREIYGIPYGDNFNIIVGYEVYLKRAENSGLLAGWRAWTDGSGADLKGCVEITRKDWTAPFYHEVYFEEYDQKNTMWKTKSRTMIKKVAIAQGFRMAFPVELGGIPYTADELPSVTDITPTQAGKPVVNQPQSKSKAPLTEAQAKYFPLIYDALTDLYGDSQTDKDAKIIELTSWVKNKGKDNEETIQGTTDYTVIKTDKTLEILSKRLDKLVQESVKAAVSETLPELCAECQQPYVDGACRNNTCCECKDY